MSGNWNAAGEEILVPATPGCGELHKGKSGTLAGGSLYSTSKWMISVKS